MMAVVNRFFILFIHYAVVISSFSIFTARTRTTATTTTGKSSLFVPDGRRKITLPGASSSPSPSKDDNQKRTIVDTSTLTLLEHVHWTIPGPKSHEHCLSFFLDVLGCGLDPRTAVNLQREGEAPSPLTEQNSILWANCGPSQLHWLIPPGDGNDDDDDVAQGNPWHIGLRFDSLDGLKHRLQEVSSGDNKSISSNGIKNGIQSFHIEKDPRTQRDFIRLVDIYGNVFFCREGGPLFTTDEQQGQQQYQPPREQPIISPDETETWGELATRYGQIKSDCRGVSYLEFCCPPNSASRIALFYESVLDATTSVLPIPGSNKHIAMIAIGQIDDLGRPDQSLLFRETDDINETTNIRDNNNNSYNGHHHIALCVGESMADFEQAFKNADLAGVVWVNQYFNDGVDGVTTLEGARTWKQFRFKDIVDMETGEVIMELEHELRYLEPDPA